MAADLADLKKKFTQIEEELRLLDAQQTKSERRLTMELDEDQYVQQCTQEIDRFLNLETLTNVDLRKIIDQICVNQDGTVRILIKALGNSAPA